MKWQANIIDSLAEVRGPIDNPANSVTDPNVIREEIFGVGMSDAGVSVTERSALQLTAVYACVRVIAEAIASLPLGVYERIDRGRRAATDHPIYPILHDRPNQWMSSIVFRETLMSHVLLWGNCYAFIVRNNAGRITSLIPLSPELIRPGVMDGRKVYKHQTTSAVFEDDEVFHVPGLGFDGIGGYSVINYIRNAVGMGVATERFGNKLFANDTTLGTVLEHPGKLGDRAAANLRKSFEDRHRGSANAYRVAILEEGMKVSRMGIPPEDSQFLETRKFQVQEIARFFRVPPHMLADLERATFSNIEHQSLEFVTQTLRRWLVAWEQECNYKLFDETDRRRFYVEHNVDGLLRGDQQARYNGYAVARNWGWLSVNDIREKENLNPIDNGDIYLMPTNMTTAERMAHPVQPTPELPQADEDNDARDLMPVLLDTVYRAMRRKHEDRDDYMRIFAPYATVAGVPVGRVVDKFFECKAINETPEQVAEAMRSK